MSTKPFLNEALQIGPWRVARKHLLFIIAFSFCIVLFGIVVLQTHIFDGSREDYDEEDDDDDDDDEDWNVGGKFGSGDWLMVVIMTISGMLAFTAVVVCFFAKRNSPRQMAVEYNKDNKGPVTSIPRATYATPQPISLIAGHIVQQIQAQQKAAHANVAANSQELQAQQPIQQIIHPPNQQVIQQQSHQTQQSSQQPVQRPLNLDAPQRIQITANPSAPNQIRVELPPPYSP